MQPQGPYGSGPQQPLRPYPSQGTPQGPPLPGQSFGPGESLYATSVSSAIPGQQPPYTDNTGANNIFGGTGGTLNAPGQQPPQTAGQTSTPAAQQGPLRPQIPGQPPLPPYQPPPSKLPRQGQPKEPDMAPPPEAPATPYDFFMQQKPVRASNPLPIAGKRIGAGPPKEPMSKGKKILFLALGGGVGLVLLLSLITALMPKDQTSIRFFTVAQAQQEIIRVCSQGISKAKYQSTRNFAVTCSTGMTNSQRQLLAYMKKINLDYEPKLLGAKASAATTAKLSKAASTSTYDAVFREVAKAQLTAYGQLLTYQLSVTSGPNGRELLAKNQRSADLLLQMVGDDSDKTEATASDE